MFDRILLLLLILLLPLGILASRFVTGELKIGSGMSSVQEVKIQALVDKLNQQVSKPAAVQEEFQITATVYASESSLLKISGLAPKEQLFLWVWSASSKSKKELKVASSSSSSQMSSIWSGPLVIWPREGGVFSADVDVAQMAGIVEVRIEQGKSVTNVRYDMDKKKAIQ